MPLKPVSKNLWLTLLLAAAGLAGTILRVDLMRLARTPGHADPAFYYTVARNLVAGRGLVLDYVFNFLDGLTGIPHYSNDFWHPLASYLLAIPMQMLGVGVFNATLSSLAAGIGIAILAFFAGKTYGKSAEMGALAAILTYFAPVQIYMSTTTDANIFFGLFGLLALYAAMFGGRSQKYFLLAAVFSGLTHLTRQDGVLILLTILGLILVARLPLKRKIALGAAVVLVHLLVLSPLLLKNYRELGAPFPSGPSSTMYMTEYEDFYAYGKTFTARTYYGALGLKGILKDKWDAAHDNLQLTVSFLDRYVAYALLIGLLDLVFLRRDREKLRQLFPALSYSLIVYLFYALVASYSRGSTPKSLALLVPFFFLIILDFMFARLRKRWIIYPLVLAGCLYLGLSGYKNMAYSHTYYNQEYDQLREIQAMLVNDAAAEGLKTGEIVVMTRDPWEFYEATGLTAIMIPNNDLETILQVARHYRVTYILLPAPRQDLHRIYNIKVRDPRLEFVQEIDRAVDIKIFRIHPDAPAPEP